MGTLTAPLAAAAANKSGKQHEERAEQLAADVEASDQLEDPISEEEELSQDQDSQSSGSQSETASIFSDPLPNLHSSLKLRRTERGRIVGRSIVGSGNNTPNRISNQQQHASNTNSTIEQMDNNNQTTATTTIATTTNQQQMHVCRLCDKLLSSSSSLDRHMLTHSGERPFVCKRCHMTFTTNGNMHRHMRTHLHKDSLARQQQEQQLKSLVGGGSPVNQQHHRNSMATLPLQTGYPTLSGAKTLPTSIQQHQFGFHRSQQQANGGEEATSNTATSAAALLNQQLVAAFKQQQQPRQNTCRLNQATFLDNSLVTEQLLGPSQHHLAAQVSNISASAAAATTTTVAGDSVALQQAVESQAAIFLRQQQQLAGMDPKTLMLGALGQGDLQSMKAVMLAAAAAAAAAAVQQQQNQLRLTEPQQLATGGQANKQSALDRNEEDEQQVARVRGKRRKQVNPRSTRANQQQQRALESQSLNSGDDNEDDDADEDHYGDQNLSDGDQVDSMGEQVSSGCDTNRRALSGASSPTRSLSRVANRDNDEEEEEEELSDEDDSGENSKNNNIPSYTSENESDINNGHSVALKRELDEEDLNNNSRSATIDDSGSNNCKLKEFTTHSGSVGGHEKDGGSDDDEEDVEEERQRLNLDDGMSSEEDEASLGGSSDGSAGMNLSDGNNNNNINNNNNRNSLTPFGSTRLMANEEQSLGDDSLQSEPQHRHHHHLHHYHNSHQTITHTNQTTLSQPLTTVNGEIIEDISQSYVKTANPNAARKGGKRNRHCYKCKLCTYSSVDRCTLVRHLRIHSGERPYICGICRYAFTTKANCERHVRKRHKKQYNSLGGAGGGGVKGSNGGGRSLIITDHSNHQTIPVKVNPVAAQNISQTLQRIQEKQHSTSDNNNEDLDNNIERIGASNINNDQQQQQLPVDIRRASETIYLSGTQKGEKRKVRNELPDQQVDFERSIPYQRRRLTEKQDDLFNLTNRLGSRESLDSQHIRQDLLLNSQAGPFVTSDLSSTNDLFANLMAQLQQVNAGSQPQQPNDQPSNNIDPQPSPRSGNQMAGANFLANMLTGKSQLRNLSPQAPFFIKRNPFDPFNPIDLAAQALDLSCKFHTSK